MGRCDRNCDVENRMPHTVEPDCVGLSQAAAVVMAESVEAGVESSLDTVQRQLEVEVGRLKGVLHDAPIRDVVRKPGWCREG